MKPTQFLGLSIVAFWMFWPVRSGAPPVISNVAVSAAPNRNAPLAAILTCSTDRPTRVSLTISHQGRAWTVAPDLDFKRAHSVVVLGLRPGTKHAIRVSVTDEQGNASTAGPLEVTTDPLPEEFPPREVKISRPEAMEPGVTLFSVYRWPRGNTGPDRDYGLLVAVDENGEVVWSYRADHQIGNARRLRNGRILYVYGRSGGLAEIDMLGNTVRQWHTTGTPKTVPKGSIPVDTDTFHHEVYELPSGHFLALSTEVRAYDNYPTSETDPRAPKASARLVGDVVVEFSGDGTVVRKWKLLDLLDPYRIGYGSLSTGFWKDTYAGVVEGSVQDWAHANAIVYDARDNAALISLRHQDAVIKLDLAMGRVKWILGAHDGWQAPWRTLLLTPRGALTWQSHQHAPMLTPSGTILLFDNGNYRAHPFAEKLKASDSYSRAVEYAVDERTRTVAQVWTYGGPSDERFYSSFIGGADWLPRTGNVLVTEGGRISNSSGDPSDDETEHHWARLVEVTHTAPPRKVFDLVIDDKPPRGWAVYRAVRLPSLYR